MSDFRYAVRRATPADAHLLSELRYQQLLDEGCKAENDKRSEMEAYFTRTLTSGEYAAWIAEDEGRPIATAAVLYQEYPPSIDWNGGHRGYVTGVYTDPAYRGQGIASHLISLIQQEAREKELGCLWLLASIHGKGVYARQGFDDERPFRDTYMEWYKY